MASAAFGELTPGGDRSEQARAARHALWRASAAIPESTEEESHDHNRRGCHGGRPRTPSGGGGECVGGAGVRGSRALGGPAERDSRGIGPAFAADRAD